MDPLRADSPAQDRSAASARARALRRFFLASYLVLVALCSGYLDDVALPDAWTSTYAVAVLLTYPLIYLLPALALTWLVHAVLRRREAPARGWTAAAVYAVAILATGATSALLYVDRRVFDLWGVHLNGLVGNALAASGKLESTGPSDSTVYLAAAIVVALLGAQALLLVASVAAERRHLIPVGLGPRYRTLLAIFLVITAGERIAYGAAHARARTPILVAADAFPLHRRLTFDELALRLGLDPLAPPARPAHARSPSR